MTGNVAMTTRPRKHSETVNHLLLVLAGFLCAFVTASCSTEVGAGPRNEPSLIISPG